MNESIEPAADAPRDRRRAALRSNRRRRAPTALALAVLALVGSPFVARAADTATAVPTDAARASYWIERLVKGPEPTSFKIPNFHKALLEDAERNLAALADVTLERLAEPALLERVQTQDDDNPWHALLTVLAQIGPRRPEVARAWAAPALVHESLTLRRAAVVVFEALKSPVDGPVLLEALARCADDRLLAPRLSGLLLRFGAPWDGRAARVLFERAAGDRPDGSSTLWTDLALVAADAPDRARPDLLAWWGLLTETTGPRAPDPAKAGTTSARSIDPVQMTVLAPAHLMTSGRLAAARARFVLARQGDETAARQVTADLDSRDDSVRDVARALAERPVTTMDREAARATAASYVAALRGGSPPTPAEVASVARTLRSDESPEALRLLEDLFRVLPPTPVWKPALFDVFDGLVVRGGDLENAMRRLLAAGGDDELDLAFLLMRRSRGPAFIPIIEAWLSTPAAEPRKHRIRRELAYLYVSRREHRELSDEEAAVFGATVRGWIEDPDDPSALGLVAVLLDLGPSGDAEVARGLAGPRRDLYVDGLDAGANRYVGRAIVEALLAPVDRRTPVAVRRRLLGLAFRAASSSATDVLEALADRSSEEGRADVETVLRIVRHR